MKDLIYGLDSGTTLVFPGQSATLSVNPQRRHRPIALAAPSCIRNFEIVDVYVGTNNSLLEHTYEKKHSVTFRWDEPPPGEEPFDTQGWLYFWKKVPVEVGNDVSIVVKNVGSEPHRFIASVLGRELPTIAELEQRIEMLEKIVREKVL